MATPRLLRPATHCLRAIKPSTRAYSVSPSSSSSAPPTSPFSPRHLLSVSDLTPTELATLVRNASTYKSAIKSGRPPPHLPHALAAQTVALMFTKRSTRTRVSSEAALARLGAHPMFLGAGDIQLGVNESRYDTSVVVSSMVRGIVTRVDAHAEVVELARHSSVPVINALSDRYHPLQTMADYQTLLEVFAGEETGMSAGGSLGLEGLKIAWIGDANNVLYDLAIGAGKLGVKVSVATPKGYEIPEFMRQIITSSAPDSNFLTETNVPEEAVKDADVLVTDTWVSMGQEAETKERLKAFEGFQITKEMAQRGGAREGWRFMHCLPRHPEEVSDEVFYSPASLVFQEAENRLWAAVSAFEAFFVNGGKIR